MKKYLPLHFVLMLVLAMSGSLSGITALAQSQSTELAIIDRDLPDAETLVREMRPGIKLVYFDKSKSITSSISEALDAFSPVSALHIITHGKEGAIFLTSGWLDDETLQKEQPEISQWKNKFIKGGDILIYGCNLAKGSTGQQFLD
jgi:fibronectin-binding autotransporter adhesin